MESLSGVGNKRKNIEKARSVSVGFYTSSLADNFVSVSFCSFEFEGEKIR